MFNQIATSIIVLVSILLLGCSRPAVLPSHNLELRLAASTAEDGMALTTMRSSGEEIYLDSAAIVVGTDFVRIIKTFDEKGRPAVLFEVNDDAGKRMSEITTANQDKMIALVINGIPETAMPLNAPFSDSFEISGTFTEKEIQQLYQAVTGYDDQ